MIILRFGYPTKYNINMTKCIPKVGYIMIVKHRNGKCNSKQKIKGNVYIKPNRLS